MRTWTLMYIYLKIKNEELKNDTNIDIFTINMNIMTSKNIKRTLRDKRLKNKEYITGCHVGQKCSYLYLCFDFNLKE